MKVFKNTDSYILSQEEGIRPLLEKLRSIIQKAAPQAVEKISYGMPAFYLNGDLVYFAARKAYIGFYATSRGNDAFKEELSSYHTTKSSIHLPLSKPLPEKLITKIVKYRVAQNLAEPKAKK